MGFIFGRKKENFRGVFIILEKESFLVIGMFGNFVVCKYFFVDLLGIF